MPYSFDEIIDRGPASCTFSAKWQGYEDLFAGYHIDLCDTLPMWVADMDFRCPPEVVDAVVKRARHGIYGYTSEDSVDAFREAASGWFERRYGWKCRTEWMLFSPGVVPAVSNAIQEFTKEGDGVIIQPPVYYPFAAGIVNNGRRVVNNRLKENQGHYEIDYEDLERLARLPENKMIVLSNPHNPVGRVWTKNEMHRVFQICRENHVMVFSDEIHGDLILKGHKLFATGLMEEFHDGVILAHAASKTFNLAGLSASLITIPDRENRERMARRMAANCLPRGSIFGSVAGAAAYIYGDKYVDEVVGYIEANIDYAMDYMKKELPAVKIIKPEGTYLVWIDFRGTGLGKKEIYRTILEEAKVAGDLGEWFGPGGEGFMRFNFACPRVYITDMLQRMTRVFKK